MGNDVTPTLSTASRRPGSQPSRIAVRHMSGVVLSPLTRQPAPLVRPRRPCAPAGCRSYPQGMTQPALNRPSLLVARNSPIPRNVPHTFGCP